MSKLPPRNDNIDLTRSTMQRKVNKHLGNIQWCHAALARKKQKLNNYNNFLNFLVSQEKITRQEIRDFFNSKKENNEKLD